MNDDTGVHGSPGTMSDAHKNNLEPLAKSTPNSADSRLFTPSK